MKVFLGVVAGFVAWLIAWIGSEMILSAIWPDWYGVHQRAFTTAIKGGGPFTADNTILLIHIACASVVSVLAGFLAVLIAGENRRAPLILGLVLLVMGVLKAVMSWPFVPIWYHLAFTALLVSMAILGGRLKGK